MFRNLKFNFPWRKNKIKKITLGICAMDKKSRSKPMKEILSRLPEDLFEITVFGDDCILNQPVESWPVCEVLISFYSKGFPTDKALEYVKMRKPLLINDLEMEATLKDRRKVYDILQQLEIPVPFHIYVNRDTGEEDKNVIEEFDEYIMVNGVQINKPLVEKPVDAEDHNIYIYYPISAGGGSKRLFRKVDDRSSEFYPTVNELRREGSYIYEEFVITQGTDVKVYTVGPEYGHAEARKSPVVDGRVKRDSDGREIRYPVILSQAEKEIARKIVRAFRQTVCGFDILRVHGKSYCCDVNGFSFVKNSRKYYEDAAQVLTETMIMALRREVTVPRIPRAIPPPMLTNSSIKAPRPIRDASTPSPSIATMDGMDKLSSEFSNGVEDRPGSPETSMMSDAEYLNINPLSAHEKRYESEELRSVIAVIRHGDRTPKQKMKVLVSHPKYLDYFHSYAKTPKKDLKVKSKSGLVKFLEVTREIIAENESPLELRRKLCQIRDVLERWEISGINRKLQMKPQKWDEEEEVPEPEIVLPVNEEGTADKDVTDAAEHGAASIPIADSDVVVENNETMPPSFQVGSLDQNSSLLLNPDIVTPFKKLASTSATSMSPPSPNPTKKKVGSGMATELLVILKWGGDLTPMGREQAEHLGAEFRSHNYPDNENGGVLRLHATYRHDLKIKASDEGRVMKTAAAFTKGLLELEGQLTPILASLVTIEEKNRTMLDRGGNFEMKEEMDRCKHHLDMLQVDQEITEELVEQIAPQCSDSMKRAFLKLGNPLQTLKRIHYLIGRLTSQLEILVTQERLILEEGSVIDCCESVTGASTPTPLNTSTQGPSTLAFHPPTAASSQDGVNRSRSISAIEDYIPPEEVVVDDEEEDLELQGLYLNETYSLMFDRWEKLNKDFYSSKTKQYDLTKVPDVYDMIRYDILHNSHLNLSGMEELFRLSSIFESCVVPQEYGIDKADKRYIGAKMCGALLEKIKHDLTVAAADGDESSLTSSANNMKEDDTMLYKLDHSHAQDLQINSLERCVRTRLYFTSESHLHTVLNVLRYAASLPNTSVPGQHSLNKEALELLDQITDVSYLSQIVIRLFEDRLEKGKFSCELSFSSGTTNDPIGDKNNSIMPYQILQKSVRLDDVVGLLNNAIYTYHSDSKHEVNNLTSSVQSAKGNSPEETCHKDNPECVDEGNTSLITDSTHDVLNIDSPIRPKQRPSSMKFIPSPLPVRRNESITVSMDELKNTSDKWEREVGDIISPIRHHNPHHHRHLTRHKSAVPSTGSNAKLHSPPVLVSKDDLDALTLTKSAAGSSSTTLDMNDLKALSGEHETNIPFSSNNSNSNLGASNGNGSASNGSNNGLTASGRSRSRSFSENDLATVTSQSHTLSITPPNASNIASEHLPEGDDVVTQQSTTPSTNGEHHQVGINLEDCAGGENASHSTVSS